MADGRVFTGHQAIDLKLVDELGDEQDRASPGSAKEKRRRRQAAGARLPASQPRFGDLPFLHAAVGALLDASASTRWRSGWTTRGAAQAVERLNLDGLLALWHPAERELDRRTVLMRPVGMRCASAKFDRRRAHMIKSELVQRISAQNPHLYQRDVENIVNAILGRDHRRAWRAATGSSCAASARFR